MGSTPPFPSGREANFVVPCLLYVSEPHKGSSGEARQRNRNPIGVYSYSAFWMDGGGHEVFDTGHAPQGGDVRELWSQRRDRQRRRLGRQNMVPHVCRPHLKRQDSQAASRRRSHDRLAR